MFPFFKKNKKQGKDSTVSSNDLLNETTTPTNETEVQTELRLHPKMKISTEQQYVLRFLNNELTPLKPNQISLSGIELQQDEDQVVVAAFVRNSLEKGVKFQKNTLLLLGPNDEKLARKEFDLGELGEIPGKSSMPWNFAFSSKDLLTREIPNDGWKLAFQLKAKHKLDLEETWEKSLKEEDKAKLREIVEKLEAPKEGEVNFMGLQAQRNENNDLHITMLIRNGSDKNINLQQLPLHVQDASGEVIAKGGFKLDNFEVKANTSKPWTFIFPKSLILKEDIDMSKWKAFTPQ